MIVINSVNKIGRHTQNISLIRLVFFCAFWKHKRLKILSLTRWHTSSFLQAPGALELLGLPHQRHSSNPFVSKQSTLRTLRPLVHELASLKIQLG